MKTNLKDYTYEELEQLVTEKLGEPRFRARQIFGWLSRGAAAFQEMTDLSAGLREKLTESYSVGNLIILEKYVSRIDETRKYLLQLEDGNTVETALMKYHHGYTICVSSQVGCAMGCAFCASTRAGRIRQLSAGEILGQVTTVQRDLGSRISHVVMMGIGEPLDNYRETLRFLRMVNHPLGLNLSHRHISLSTCGLADRIRDLAKEHLQITLSVSLHAAHDAKRSEIMPVNRKYPLRELLDACREYIRETNRRITFEYTLIRGVNDTPGEAEALRGLLRGLLCHVNLIPVNPVAETAFVRSGRETIENFQRILEAGGIPATIRREMGADISAACGQLRVSRLESQ